MRLLDRLIARALRGPLDALVTERVLEQVEQLKLDALYSYRWHGPPGPTRREAPPRRGGTRS